MKIKQRIDDFRVRELLDPDFVVRSGEHRVYRVTKRKLTSFQAAEALAGELGVAAGDVSMAGLKDRQGVTVQFMSVRRGKDLSLNTRELRIETVGFSNEPVTSSVSHGNAFEITVRELDGRQLSALRRNAPIMRERGTINYFDDQRFGNLRHNQGWIALDLMRGEHEAALRRLLCAISPHDSPRNRDFKSGLDKSWGDWVACREIAGRFGQHHSVFEYLKGDPSGFAGAFYHVATRTRLIHLYALQSHVWNRAVADYVREHVPSEQRVVLKSHEGPLVYPDSSSELKADGDASFRLPGPGMEDVRDPGQLALLEDVIARERLVAADFRIDGVPGFQLKGEDRPLWVRPAHLRQRPPRDDVLHRGYAQVVLRFELPRGAYATLIVRRLLGEAGEASLRSEDRGAPARGRDRRRSGGTRERGGRGAGATRGRDGRGSDAARGRDERRGGSDASRGSGGGRRDADRSSGPGAPDRGGADRGGAGRGGAGRGGPGRSGRQKDRGGRRGGSRRS